MCWPRWRQRHRPDRCRAALSNAALGAGYGDDFSANLRHLPHLFLVPLDQTLADQAADIAVQHRLRSSDAVYAAVALRFGSTLATLDQEQRERVAAVIPTCLPAEALMEWS